MKIIPKSKICRVCKVEKPFTFRYIGTDGRPRYGEGSSTGLWVGKTCNRCNLDLMLSRKKRIIYKRFCKKCFKPFESLIPNKAFCCEKHQTTYLQQKRLAKKRALPKKPDKRKLKPKRIEFSKIYCRNCLHCNVAFISKRVDRYYCKEGHTPYAIKSRKEFNKYKKYKHPLSKYYKHEIMTIYANKPQGMEVDHIVPRNGVNVCGLHVPWNLQYLTPEENRKKSNKVIDKVYST